MNNQMYNILVPGDTETMDAFSQLLASVSRLSNEIIYTNLLQEDEEFFHLALTDYSDKYVENTLAVKKDYIDRYLQKIKNDNSLTSLSNACAVKAYIAFEIFLQKITKPYQKNISFNQSNIPYLLGVFRNNNPSFKLTESAYFPFENWMNVFTLAVNLIVTNNSYVAMDELGSLPDKEKKIFASFFQLQEITTGKKITYRISCKCHIEDILQILKEYAHLIFFFDPGNSQHR